MDICTYENGLKSRVVDKGLCCRCGTCGAVCPKTRNMRAFNPLMPKGLSSPPREREEEECRLCLEVCPMENVRTGDGIGNVLAAWRARATNEEVLEKGQDGGACTAFLGSLKDLTPIGISSRDGLPIPIMGLPMECIGTKYGATSSISILTGREKGIAFVGLPCQMTGISLAQERGCLGSIELKVGLFCTKNFYHRALEKALEAMDIDIGNIVRMDIKSKLILDMKDGEIMKLPLSRFEDCVLGGCERCRDFCSFDGDIVFGSIGTKEGYTTVLTRTRKAEKLFQKAVEEGFLKADNKVDMNEIIQSQKRKGLGNG